MSEPSDLLTEALVQEVVERLRSGVGFLRIPQFGAAMPFAEMVAGVREQGFGARVADFAGSGVAASGGIEVTSEVTTAIAWRDDPDDDRPLLILGDIQRNRAAGLARVFKLNEAGVRRRMFENLRVRASDRPQPALALALLKTLSDCDFDLQECADYCSAVGDPESVDFPTALRSELYLLGLLPMNSETGRISSARIARNSEVLERVRGADPATVQRLVRRLADGGTVNFDALRRFSLDGDRAHLRALELADVEKALVGVRDTETSGDTTGTDADLLVSAQANFDESVFLETVRGVALGDTGLVSVGDSQFDWPVLELSDSVKTLLVPTAGLEDDLGQSEATLLRYVSLTGDVRRVGEGGVETLVELRALLAARELDNDVSEEQSVAQVLDVVIQSRQQLAPYVPSLTRRGVELLSLSKILRDAARTYLESWTLMWTRLRDLSQSLPREATALRQAADMLVLTDLRVSEPAAGEVDVVVLPLHPVFLQPRLTAAQAFADQPGSRELFEVVTASLDPAVPVFSVPTVSGGENVVFDRFEDGLLRYSSRRSTPRRSSAARVVTASMERFVSAHPFAKASMSVCLVEPAADLVQELRREVGRRPLSERLALVIVTAPSEEDVIRDALAHARESLEVTDSDLAEVKETVLCASLVDVPAQLESAGISPHIAFLLNVLDAGSLVNIAAPGKLQGSVLSEWLFDVSLVNGRPIITPNPHKELSELVHIQQAVANVSTPVARLNPLLKDGVAAVLAELSHRCTWVVASGQQVGLAASPVIGEAQLLGRLAAMDESAYVYSANALTLVEPALRLMQQSAWFATSAEEVFRFLSGTLRMALPEGVLGFFRSRGGELAGTSVMERLGVAAVLNDLRSSHEDQLIVSLDTQAARDWLENREPPHRRADLLSFRWDGDDEAVLTAIEVKSTSTFAWGSGQAPPLVDDAYSQVDLMTRLLRQVFGLDADEVGFATSRREVIKRQVFLDALQQWDDLRTGNPDLYRKRILRLNELFEHGPKDILSSIYVVGVDTQSEIRERSYGSPPAHVTILDRQWLQAALRPDGTPVAIPQELLDVIESPYQDSGDLMNAEVDPGIADRQSSSSRISGGSQPEPDAERAVPPPEDMREADTESPVAAEDLDRAAIARSVWEVLRERIGRVKRLDESKIVFGPSVVLVPFETEVGTKLAQLRSQEEDLARDLAVASVRVVNIPNEARMAGLELARQHRLIPNVTSVTRHEGDDIYLALGTRVTSAPCWARLAELPHLLVAGAPGGGKSVFLRSALWQLSKLYRPDELDLVLIDGKGMADYLDFEGAAHFKAASDFHVGADGALDLMSDVVEVRVPAMVSHFKELAREALGGTPPAHIRDIGDAIKYARSQDIVLPIRPLVVVVDEFAELMMTAPDRRRFEDLVTKFVQRARALGGHLIAATQRPSVDVVPGVMKSNFARLALRVNSAVDSRVILDEAGAEWLLGKGDLLFKSPSEGLLRLQGYAALDHYE